MTKVVPLRLVPREAVELLDQTLLPHRETYVRVATVDALCEAIASLRVRGAPLLGLAGASGMAIAVRERGSDDAALREAAGQIAAARPTAVDLPAAVHEALTLLLGVPEMDRARVAWAHAQAYAERRVAEDRALGTHGAVLLPQGGAVLTHCNTGALATGGIGSALGVIRVASEEGRLAHVYATETRPLLQGARLTAWELSRLGISATLLPDTAAASLLGSGRVQAVVTGADRVAANGDSANKVGTLQLALAAAGFGVPFYIAAPMTTVDFACPDGSQIPIEFRDEREVGGFGEARWAPDGVGAYNPAFDVTPSDLITAIITERGVARAPFEESLRVLRGAQMA